MRYRPFGKSGMALSTVGLRLGAHAAHKGSAHIEKIVTTALENGINAYMFDWDDPALLQTAAQALSLVERHILFIGLSAANVRDDQTYDYSLVTVRNRLKPVIRESGLQWIDLLQFHDPDISGLPDETVDFVDTLRHARMVRQMGVRSDSSEVLGEAIHSRRFQSIETSFDIDATWNKRQTMSTAVQHEMSVLGSRFFPEAYAKANQVIPAAARRGFFGLSKPEDPLAGVGTYAFLHQTPNWSAEQLCLGYALSQASLSCIFLEVDSPEHLEEMAEVTERDLPPSVPAQIEMARFSGELKAQA